MKDIKLKLIKNFVAVLKEENKKFFFDSFFVLLGGFFEISETLMDLICFNEVLKSFNTNKFSTDKIYIFGDKKFQIAQKNGEIYLKIQFEEEVIFLNRVESVVLQGQIQKIISKCEFTNE